jgi:hypothetical protein
MRAEGLEPSTQGLKVHGASMNTLTVSLPVRAFADHDERLDCVVNSWSKMPETVRALIHQIALQACETRGEE